MSEYNFLDHLTPLPLVAKRHRVYNADAKGEVPATRGMRSAGDPYPHVASMNSEEDARFFVLARQAYEIMMRRKWSPIPCAAGGWEVADASGCLLDESPNVGLADPFTALVAADAWMTAQEAAP